MAKKLKKEASEGPAVKIDASVRWVTVSGERKKAICFRGERYGLCVIADSVIHVYRISPTDLDKLNLVKFGPDPYPVGREVDKLRHLQEQIGITWAAHRLLHAWMLGYNLPRHEIDTTLAEDEVFHIRSKTPSVELDAETSVKAPPAKPAKSILGLICIELGIGPGEARKRLRSRGMRAPYDNSEAIRGALKCNTNG